MACQHPRLLASQHAVWAGWLVWGHLGCVCARVGPLRATQSCLQLILTLKSLSMKPRPLEKGQHEQGPLKFTELVISTTLENLSVTESRSVVAVSPGHGEADLSGWH